MPDLFDRAQEVSARQLADALETHQRGRGQKQQSRTYCIDCEDPIPQARRNAAPGCQRCIKCQQVFEGGC